LAKEKGVTENLYKRVGIINHLNVIIVEPNQQPSNGKLQLKKQAVSNLSRAELEHVQGGDPGLITTSWGGCTGWTCCGSTTETVTISFVITTLIFTTTFTCFCFPAAD
jgi:hypothetical protein